MELNFHTDTEAPGAGGERDGGERWREGQHGKCYRKRFVFKIYTRQLHYTETVEIKIKMANVAQSVLELIISAVNNFIKPFSH